MYLSVDELKNIGFKSVGENTKISRQCCFYNITGSIGAHVRIDDFCILKGSVELYPYVHIASFGMISGAHATVRIKDFVGIAARATILSGSDDYAADTLGNPCTPADYTTIIKGPVTIGLGTMIGAHVVILPNVHIGEGASIGSGCLVWKDIPDGGMVRAPKSILMDKKRDFNRIKELAVRVYENAEGSSC